MTIFKKIMINYGIIVTSPVFRLLDIDLATEEGRVSAPADGAHGAHGAGADGSGDLSRNDPFLAGKSHMFCWEKPWKSHGKPWANPRGKGWEIGDKSHSG